MLQPLSFPPYLGHSHILCRVLTAPGLALASFPLVCYHSPTPPLLALHHTSFSGPWSCHPCCPESSS